MSPTYAVELFINEPAKAFFALGSIFLVVTGGEALYADMGHFGRHPIQLSWYTIVLPALVLCYFGQAALIGSNPESVESPFYDLAPSWGVVPLAILATFATVIASQALISGAFSLTAQAVQLDYLPRLKVVHTSSEQSGQIYVPAVNWLLAVGLHRARARLPVVRCARLGVRDRGHDDDVHHDAPVLPRRRATGGSGRGGTRCWSASRCSRSTWRSSRRTSRRFRRVAGSRCSSAGSSSC